MMIMLLLPEQSVFLNLSYLHSDSLIAQSFPYRIDIQRSYLPADAHDCRAMLKPRHLEVF